MEKKRELKGKDLIGQVVYADMYDCAILQEDLVKFWGFSEELIERLLDSDQLIQMDGRISLPGREKLIARTNLAIDVAKKKVKYAKKILAPLKKIPWVKTVGLSGGVGARNSSIKDDLDVFFIVEADRQWLVRLLEIIYFRLFKRVGAFKNTKNRENKFCFNLYLVENDKGELTLPESKQNLFTAYQSLLVKILYGREHYAKFLSDNQWIKGFFPGVNISVKNSFSEKQKKNIFLDWINSVLGGLQLIKIILGGGKVSDVLIKDHLFFHPEDPSKKIIKKFGKRMKRFE